MVSAKDLAGPTIAIALARGRAQNIFVFAGRDAFFDAISDHNGDFLT
jgi:hypothetical protein